MEALIFLVCEFRSIDFDLTVMDFSAMQTGIQP
jgi:hypothetical protein